MEKEEQESQDSETLNSNMQDLNVMLNYFGRTRPKTKKDEAVAKKGLRETLKNTFSQDGNILSAIRAVLEPEEIKKLVQDESVKLSPAIVEELSQDFQIRRKPRKCKNVNNPDNVQGFKREPSLDLGVQEFSDESEDDNEVQVRITPQKRKNPTARKSTRQNPKIITDDDLELKNEENPDSTEDQSTPKKRKPTARKSVTKGSVIKTEELDSPGSSSNLKVLSPQTINRRSSCSSQPVTNFFPEKKQRNKSSNAKRFGFQDLLTPEIVLDNDSDTNESEASEDLLANVNDVLPDLDPNEKPDSQETTISENEDPEDRDPSFNPDDSTLVSEDSFQIERPRSIRTRRQRQQNPEEAEDDIFENTLQPTFRSGIRPINQAEPGQSSLNSDNEDNVDRQVTSTPKPKKSGKSGLKSQKKKNVEDKENNVLTVSDNDEDDDLPMTSTPKPKKPGKASLMNHLRNMVESESDENLTDDAIVEQFALKESLFSANPGICVCNMENSLNTRMIKFHVQGQPDKDIDLCPRCVEIMSKTGQDENRKMFLKMVHEVHFKGIQATYVRSEGQNKRIFELHGTYKWLKSLKDPEFRKQHPLLSKASCIKVNSSQKVFIELRPAAKTASEHRKKIRNAKDKFKIFIKTIVSNGKLLFSLQDAECISGNAGTSAYELQTSIHDFFPSKK